MMITPVEKPTSMEMIGAKLLSDRTQGNLQVLTYLLRRVTSNTGVTLSPSRVVELHLRPGTAASWWERHTRVNVDRGMEESV